jgi:hypothetical protein
MYSESFTMQSFSYRVLQCQIFTYKLNYWRKSNVCIAISMQENHEPKIRDRRKSQGKYILIGG